VVYFDGNDKMTESQGKKQQKICMKKGIIGIIGPKEDVIRKGLRKVKLLESIL